MMKLLVIVTSKLCLLPNVDKYLTVIGGVMHCDELRLVYARRKLVRITEEAIRQRGDHTARLIAWIVSRQRRYCLMFV